MKDKKKFYITVSIIIILVIALLIGKNVFSSKKQNDDRNEKPENSTVTIDKKDDKKYLTIKDTGEIEDKNTGYVIYDPKKKYSIKEETLFDLKNLDSSVIAEYIKWFALIYPMQSFEKFDDNTIATIVSLSIDSGSPKTDKEIERVAEQYFGIKNYQLPTGTYKIEGYGDYSITKQDNYYIKSSINNKKENIYAAYPTDIKIDNDKIKLYLDFAPDSFTGNQKGCYTPLDVKEKCIKGYYEIDLTYSKNNNNMVVEKIAYKSNTKFNPSTN